MILPKLSKEERWLVEQAVEEWGYVAGDFFSVGIVPGNLDRNKLVTVATLMKDDYSGDFFYVASKPPLD